MTQAICVYEKLRYVWFINDIMKQSSVAQNGNMVHTSARRNSGNEAIIDNDYDNCTVVWFLLEILESQSINCINEKSLKSCRF